MQLPASIETPYEIQLAAFFEIDVARVDYRQTHQLSEGVRSVMVDCMLLEGAPTIDTLFEKLTSELKAMAGSTAYGCVGTTCTDYKSKLAVGSVLQYVNPFYLPALNAAFMVDATPKSEPSDATGFIIAGIIVAIVVLLGMFLFWRRHQKAKKFSENQLLSYQDTEPGYVAQTDVPKKMVN